MQSSNTLLWLTTYRIFQVLMLFSFIGYFSYYRYFFPMEGLPWTALVIPFIPVWVPFMYRLIFRDDQPQQLWLYLGALALFLAMEGFLFLPYTVFGFTAIALNLGISLALAQVILRLARPDESPLAVAIERNSLLPQLPAPTGFEIKLDTLAAELSYQERTLAQRAQHWQQQLKGATFSPRERKMAEQALAISELNQAQVNLIRQFLALIARPAPLADPDRALVQRIQTGLSQHQSGEKILSADLQKQLLERIQA